MSHTLVNEMELVEFRNGLLSRKMILSENDAVDTGKAGRQRFVAK